MSSHQMFTLKMKDEFAPLWAERINFVDRIVTWTHDRQKAGRWYQKKLHLFVLTYGNHKLYEIEK